MKIQIIALAFIFSFTLGISAQEIDEAAFFSDEQSLVGQDQVLDMKLGQDDDKESVSFSGVISNRSLYLMHKDWLKGKDAFDQNQMISENEADIFLDVRLKKQTKAFVNLSLISTSLVTAVTDNIIENAVKEFFIDTNINKKIYLRMGKQVLQWGRTYFWHPTDLINIDRLDFFDMGRYRRGVYGLKMHVPFDTAKNFYMFYNFAGATNIDEVAVAAKMEFLVQNTEFAFSAWKKKGYGPAYGFDFSSNVFNIDVMGEASLLWSRNKQFVSLQDNSASLLNKADAWETRASIALSKTFDWEYSNRIRLMGELFLNGSGYQDNLFSNTQARDLLFDNDLYKANYHSCYYGAVFASVSKYPITDTSVHANTLANLSDGSFVVVTGLDYEPIDHFSLSFNLNFFGGPEQGEYTYNGYGLAFDVFTTVIF